MPENSNTGVLNINKPAGPTSHDIVARLRRLTGLKRVGHTGTLDPFATGVLLVVLGPATRLIQYTHALPKEYVATVTLGASSTTDDRTGNITPSQEGEPSVDAIRAALKQFEGHIKQTPPTFSAVKIKGRKLYEHARAGESITAPPRPVTIHHIDLLNYTYPTLTLKISCSTGTYIRSLARDLGRSLNTEAYVEELQRTKIGKFTVENSVKVDALTTQNPHTYIQPVTALVEHLSKVALSLENVAQFRQGRSLPWNNVDVSPDNPCAVYDSENNLVGIGTFDPATHLLKPRTVLPF